MKKLVLFLLICINYSLSLFAQGFGAISAGGAGANNIKTASGEVYFQVKSATRPQTPKAASFDFNTQGFQSLTNDWLPATPSGVPKFWKAKYMVTEKKLNAGTGVPVFELPTLDSLPGGPGPGAVAGSGGKTKGTFKDATVGQGVGEKVVKKSLRGEDVSEDNMDSVKQRLNNNLTPLPYDYLRKDHWLFSEFIWREIDTREKFNQHFIYEGEDNSGDQRFISILLNSIKNDSIWAFSPTDGADRFTTRLPYNEIADRINGPKKILERDSTDINGTVIKTDSSLIYESTLGIKIDSIYTFRIKEQWVFDKETSRMHVRVLGICPVASVDQIVYQGGVALKKKLDNSIDSTVSKPQDLFWIYYPDLRNILVNKKVYNPKSVADFTNWDKIFLSRRYIGRIVKTSYDNPKNLDLKDLISNPLFRLLEGENIKTRILNYEQGLWSY
jgi:gliding motility associated protien GldN